MSDWTNNWVEISGKKDTVVGIKNMLNNEKENIAFDFNKIMPMPESLDIVEGSKKIPAIIHYLYKEKGGYMQMFKDKKCQKMLDTVGAAGLVLTDPEYLINSHLKYLEYAKYANESLEELYSLGKQYLDNIKNYGFSTWYDWCTHNWGTKWNACDSNLEAEEEYDDSNYVIRYAFDTAWSAPFGIYEKLHELYPDVTISVTYADERDVEEHHLEYGGFTV